MGLSDWLRAAKTQTNAVANIHAAGLENMPDIVGLQVTAMNAKSKERQTAIAAEAKVRQAGMRALGNVKETRIGVDAKEEINDMKVDNFRKAGIIGALGTVAAGGVSAMQNNQAQKRADEREAAEQQQFDDRMAYIKESTANMPKPPEVTPFEAKPFEYDGGSTSASRSTSTSGSSTSTGASSSSVPTGGTVTAKTIAEMAAKSGAKYPKLVAAQWALESAWGKTPSGKNNYFGIKAKPGESSTSKGTWEVINGKEVTTSANFKDYDSPQGSVDDLVSKWYKNYGNYQGVNNANSASEAAGLLVREGYATDPKYAEKLRDIMSRFDF